MATVGERRMSNVLPHCLSDCVVLECLGVFSSIQGFVTELSGAARSDLALSLRRNLCAGLIAFDHVEDKKEFGPPATTYLIMLIGAFAAGWFVGVFSESYVQDQTSRRETSARIGRVD
jgi:hypothetical protein